MKRLLSIILALTMLIPAVLVSADDNLNIIDAIGGFESIAVRWTNTEAVDGYSVYVKKSSASAYPTTPIDKELIRYYGNYYRADALGLAAGTYDIKVEGGGASQEVTGISVRPHVREGFAFSKSSSTKTASGGYNDDGTVKSGAYIVYVDKDNVNTVELTLQSGSKTTTAKGISSIFDKFADTSGKYLIVRVIGTLDGKDIKGLSVSEGKPAYHELKGCKNVTIEGVGSDATLLNHGVTIVSSSNIEIRNLGIMLFPDDGISINGSGKNVWIHNNDFFYGAVGKDADQVKGDGSLDIKKSSPYQTISYNHFWDSGKSSLIQPSSKSAKGDGTDYLTYHHNWFDHSDSRHPRIRYANVHMYNNYFDGNSDYGVGVTSGASAFVENNVFRNVGHPMLSSMQGSDNGTFSKEAGGIIKAYNNQITGGGKVIYYSGDSDFDAYLVDDRADQVPATVTTKLSTKDGYTYNNTYSNFDTASSMYAYTPNDTESVVEEVTAMAGRNGGGDFKFNLNAYTPENGKTPDEDKDLIPELKAMLEAYTSSLVKDYAAGETEYPATTGETPEPNPTNPPAPTPGPTASPAPTAEPTAASTEEPTAEPTNPVGVFYNEQPALNGKTVTASIVNYEDESGALFVAAAYDGDAVVEVLTEIVPMNQTTPQDVTLEFTKQYTDVRFYLWSSGTLEPYEEVVIVK